MKKVLLLTAIVSLLVAYSYSQSVGIGTNSPHSSAQLDVSSTTKGLLIPRMTSTQRTSIASPANGLLVFDTDTNSFWYYSGSGWINLLTMNSGWSVKGNSGTNPASNFIGTTDSNSLLIKVNNQKSGYLGSGDGNVYWGYHSGDSNQSYSNVGIGIGAMAKNTNKSNLVAIGDSALYNNSIGAYYSYQGTGNTAVGSKALYNNTTGFLNSAIGDNSLYSNTGGSYNTASGFYAMYSNTQGLANAAYGRHALYSNTIGYKNTASGGIAMYSNTTGSSNTANGEESMRSNTTGSFNTGLGYLSDVATGNLTNATAIGANAQVNCSNCMVLGSINGVNGGTSDVNVGIGTNNPLFPLSFSGTLGDKISLWNDGTSTHYGFGVQAGLFQVFAKTVSDNIAFGYGNSTSFTETMRIQGNGNVGIGTSAPINRLDIAGLNNWDLNGTEGDVRIGNSSYRLKIGVALFGGGAGSTGLMQYGQTGGYNVLYLGSQGNAVLYINGTTSRAGIGTDNPSEKLEVIGNVKAASFIVASDARLKKDIKPIENAMEQITQLNGYNYYWKDRTQDPSLQSGILAQEVEQVLPDLVKKDNKGMLGVNYQGMIPYLIEALKEQQSEITNLKSELIEVKKDADGFETKLLKKIEELTLYVIELKKESEKQQEEINKLKSQMK